MISETKKKIIEAALKLFSSRPYSRVSVEEVASKAGVSKGAVFHYFKSKADLAEAVLKVFFDIIVSRPLNSILESNASFEEKIGRIVRLSTSVTLKGNFKAMLFLANIYEELRRRGRGDIVGKLYSRYLDLLTEFFKRNGVREPEVKAMLFMAMLDGLSFQAMIHPEAFKDSRKISEVVREVVRFMRC